MKNHIKSLLCGLCAAALALGCTGCGGSAGPEVPAKVTDIMCGPITMATSWKALPAL